MGDYVYLRVEKRDEAKTRHKLAAIAVGPYPVLRVLGNTVVIERLDRSVGCVKGDQVTLSPQEGTS